MAGVAGCLLSCAAITAATSPWNAHVERGHRPGDRAGGAAAAAVDDAASVAAAIFAAFFGVALYAGREISETGAVCARCMGGPLSPCLTAPPPPSAASAARRCRVPLRVSDGVEGHLAPNVEHLQPGRPAAAVGGGGHDAPQGLPSPRAQTSQLQPTGGTADRNGIRGIVEPTPADDRPRRAITRAHTRTWVPAMEHDNGPADHPPDLRPLAARLRFTISRLARSRDTLPERGSGDRADNTDAATDEPVRTPDAVSPDDDDDYLRRVNLARRSTWRFRGPLRTDESPRMDVYCRVCRLPIYLELTDYDTIYSGLLVTTQAPEWASLRAVGPERQVREGRRAAGGGCPSPGLIPSGAPPQSARRTTQGREGERRYACSNGCSKHQVVLTVSERPIRYGPPHADRGLRRARARQLTSGACRVWGGWYCAALQPGVVSVAPHHYVVHVRSQRGVCGAIRQLGQVPGHAARPAGRGGHAPRHPDRRRGVAAVDGPTGTASVGVAVGEPTYHWRRRHVFRGSRRGTWYRALCTVQPCNFFVQQCVHELNCY